MNATQEEKQLKIRKILVTLDASPHSRARVETAAELAADLHAELIGLFVEDANLLKVAGLPFAREISPFSPLGSRIQREQLELELRVQSERMSRVLAAAATARNVPWEFKVARGSVAAEVLAAAAEADLMIVGKMTWAPAGGRRLGSTVRMILSQSRGLTLVVHEQIQWTFPITVIFDGSAQAIRALDIAAALARIREGRLNIFVVAPDRETARKMQEQIFEELTKQKLGVEFRILIQPSLKTIAWLVRIHGSDPVVLPCSERLLEGDQLFLLVHEISNPILFVR